MNRIWRRGVVLAGASAIGVLCAAPLLRSAEPDKEEIGVQLEPKKTVKQRRRDLQEAIRKADQVIRRYKEERGLPGVSVGVSVDGEIVWKAGYGYADLETLTPCTADSVMRIASISKSLTMTIVAKLMQDGSLDLDAPIQKYVPTFPEKTFNDEKVCITTRHLVSHLGGIRHYDKAAKDLEITAKTSPTATVSQTAANVSTPSQQQTSGNLSQGEASTAKRKAICEKCQGQIPQTDKVVSEFENEEYYSRKQYNSVTEALDMFKDDPLMAKPGSKFFYTSHGWTLVSAAIEGATGKSFPGLLKALFSTFGMHHTYLDENQPIIPNRVRRKSNNFNLENVSSVNNSYKWAAGGLMSTVGDLLSFGNTLLYFYHRCPGGITRNDCYLNRQTLDKIWTPAENAGTYAMGWDTIPDQTLHNRRFYVFHTGGAVGASSVLLLKPRAGKHDRIGGITVAFLTNVQECNGMSKLGRTLADIFDI